MAQNKTFTKIQTFVKEQIKATKNSVVITTTTNGFKINDLTVQQKDSAWIVKNSTGIQLGMFNNQRLAVLTAALTVRKLYNQVQTIATMDSKLTTLKHDKSLFEIMIAKDHKKELFEDRYSRTIFELSQLYERIIELEKSVHLQ